MLANSSLRKKILRRKSTISIDSSNNMIYQYYSQYHSQSSISSPRPRNHKHVSIKKKLYKVKPKRKKRTFDRKRSQSKAVPRCVDHNTSQDEISTKMFCSVPTYDRRTVNSAASSYVQNYYLDRTTPIQKIIDTRGCIDFDADLIPSIPKPTVKAALEQPRTLVTRPMKMSHFMNKMQKFQNILKVTGNETERRIKYKEISTSVGSKLPSYYSAGSYARKYFFQDMVQPSVDCDASAKFPVLKNRELIRRFMSVSLSNNQKGRLRQVLRQIVCGPSPKVIPEVINNRIQTILRSSVNLTDTDLRKIRILYNMLQNAISQEEREKASSICTTELPAVEKTEETVKKKEEKKERKKRYTVFIGNLQKNVTKDDILRHFSDLQEFIKDVRIPRIENNKSGIAYLELSTEPSYEMALSKNHTMMNNRRINVMYTVSKNSKVSKAEAKAKAAKLSAMVKNGILTGSRPQVKKRSHRRAIMRQHRKNEEKKNP